MVSDSAEGQAVKEAKSASEAPKEALTPRGIGSMQGNPEASEPAESIPDQSYRDGKGRDLTMRTYPNGDGYMVRVFDQTRTPQPPDQPSFGDAGRANLHLERGEKGQVARAKLQDIDTTPGYEGAGTGSAMLGQCESIAKEKGASEIYGTFTPKEGQAEQTRRFYENRGYQFSEDGSQISKQL